MRKFQGNYTKISRKFQSRIRIRIRKDPRAGSGSGSEMTLQVGSGSGSGSEIIVSDPQHCFKGWIRILTETNRIQNTAFCISQLWAHSFCPISVAHLIICARTIEPLLPSLLFYFKSGCKASLLSFSVSQSLASNSTGVI